MDCRHQPHTDYCIGVIHQDLLSLPNLEGKAWMIDERSWSTSLIGLIIIDITIIRHYWHFGLVIRIQLMTVLINDTSLKNLFSLNSYFMMTYFIGFMYCILCIQISESSWEAVHMHSSFVPFRTLVRLSAHFNRAPRVLLFKSNSNMYVYLNK